MKFITSLLGMTAILMQMWVARGAPGDPRLTTLVVFHGTNGVLPTGALLLGTDGNFYGATHGGGVHDIGTLFRLEPNGKFTTLASFDGQNGKWPTGGLAQGSDGSIYGTASQGGTKSGDGVVFKMTPDGKLTSLFSFSDYNDIGNESLDGYWPARIVNGNDGYFYGTTTCSRFGQGSGTFFRITPDGVLATLGTFEPNGEAGWLVEDRNGKYSFTTTRLGFRLLPLNSMASVKKLGSLKRLLQGKDGSFYGTALERGMGSGTIFKVSANGAIINLIGFDENKNGRMPVGELIQALDGYFYGATFAGSTNPPPSDVTKSSARGGGTLFRLTTNGVITTLAVFYGTNGCYPTGGLVQGKDGTFYGMTSRGGAGPNAFGTIFRLTITPR